jgi:hypothetical protein
MSHAYVLEDMLSICIFISTMRRINLQWRDIYRSPSSKCLSGEITFTLMQMDDSPWIQKNALINTTHIFEAGTYVIFTLLINLASMISTTLLTLRFIQFDRALILEQSLWDVDIEVWFRINVYLTRLIREREDNFIGGDHCCPRGAAFSDLSHIYIGFDLDVILVHICKQTTI